MSKSREPMVIEIRIDRTSLRRAGVLLCTVFILGVAAVSRAVPVPIPDSFTDGKPLTAKQLNDNFAAVETRLKAAETTLAKPKLQVVSARYTLSATQSIPKGSEPIVQYDTKAWDTHNAVTTGALWRFTAPAAGQYIVSASALWNVTTCARLWVSVNGGQGGNESAAFGFGDTAALQHGTPTVNLKAYDTLSMRVEGGCDSMAITGGERFSFIDIYGVVALP